MGGMERAWCLSGEEERVSDAPDIIPALFFFILGSYQFCRGGLFAGYGQTPDFGKLSRAAETVGTVPLLVHRMGMTGYRFMQVHPGRGAERS